MSREQACYQRDSTDIFLHRNRDEGQRSRNPNHYFREATLTYAGECHPCASCVKCHPCRYAICKNEPGHDAEEAVVCGRELMARRLHEHGG